MSIADLFPEIVRLFLDAGAMLIVLIAAFAPRFVLTRIEASAGVPVGGR